MALREAIHQKAATLIDLRLLARLLPSVLSGFRAHGPRLIDLELTNRCNLRCRMCWFYGESGTGDRHRGGELSTDEVFRLVDQASHFKSAIYLGGAEPLLRRDFFEILEYIKAQGLSVMFTTNGTLFDPGKIQALVRLGVDHVVFSVDGHEQLHDEIRGQGTYRRIILAIRELSTCRKQRGSTKPFISVNLTVTKTLPTRLKDTIDAVMDGTDDGVDCYRIHHLWFITRDELLAHQAATRRFLGCSAAGAASHLIPNSQVLDVAALADEILSLKTWRKVQSFPDFAHDDLLKYYAEGGRIEQRCIAPFLGVVIKPNGDVTFCPDEWIDDYVLGNIRNDPLEAIWNNARARRFRLALFRQKCFPACKRCSFMYSLRNP